MRLIVSGSRGGYRPPHLAATLDGFLAMYSQLTLIEGCAPGVDHQVEGWARRHGAVEMLGRERGHRQPAIARLVLEHWPAQWMRHEGCWCNPDKTRCNYAGHRRNREMADASPDRVLAVHADIRVSRGTRNMAALAHKRGVPLDLLGSAVPVEELDEWAEELAA